MFIPCKFQGYWKLIKNFYLPVLLDFFLPNSTFVRDRSRNSLVLALVQLFDLDQI